MMKNPVRLFLLLISAILFAQKIFSSELLEDKNCLNAYWYAVPTDSVSWQKFGETTYCYSIVHVYGKEPKEDFIVRIKAYDEAGKFFEKQLDIKDGKSVDPEIKYYTANGYFRLESPTGTEMKRPDIIDIEIESQEGHFTRRIPCVYHTISGHFTDFDGNPFKAFIRVSPDDFSSPICVWSDDSGKYNITLPERSYNTFYADDHTYGVNTLEYWGWRMIVDRDETFDIKIGNGEVYNLHAWASNGGYNTYFLYFRPMALSLVQTLPEEYMSKHILNGKDFELMNIAPVLEEKDISIKLNGEVLPIVSLQPVYETAKVNKGEYSSMRAYILQVERPQSAKAKKLTFEVSYDTHITINGELIRVNSMGHCQLYTNITGLSEYSK